MRSVIRTTGFVAVLLACSGCSLLQGPSVLDAVDCGSAESEPIAKMPTCIYCPEPVYPALAHRAHMEGDVTVQILVGKDGFPIRAFFSDSSGVNAGFEESSLEAALASRFTPAETESRCEVRAWTAKVYVFRIEP